MHDPCHVVHEIRYPLWEHKPHPIIKHGYRRGSRQEWERMSEKERRGRDAMWPRGYRNPLITIWHVDPESDGSDSSCRNALSRLTVKQRERLRALAWNEARDPHFLKRRGTEWNGTMAEAESYWRGLMLVVAEWAGIPVTLDYATEWAAKLVHTPDCCPPRHKLCFEPGYHTNLKEDTREQREDRFFGICQWIAGHLIERRQPWWKYPKWHFWHWRIQVHPLQNWWHRNFAKCDVCGKKMGRATRIGTCWDTPRVAWWKRLALKRQWYVRHENCQDPVARNPTISTTAEPVCSTP